MLQECHPCRSTAQLVIFYLMLLIGWYVINVIVSRSVASLEMILGWAQLANIIGDVNLNWTKMVQDMFGVANILDFDVDILQPTCIRTWGFKQNFITQLFLPFIMTFMGCNGYLGSAIVYFLMKRNWLKLDGRKKEILALFVNIPENADQLREKWDSTIATFLASVDIMYVTIAKYCFDVFKCETIAGVSVLRVDASVECDEDHIFLTVLASIGIIFYVVGYLIYVIWKLFDLRNRRVFSLPRNLRRYGFIYQKYELDYYYTPAIMLVRKLLFVFVLVYVNNPAFQVGAIAVIINTSLMIHVYTAPYVDTYLDVLFNFLLLALMFEAFGGLMFYSENLPDANREILEWIVMVTLFLLIAVFLVIFVMEIFMKYHMHFLKSEHRKFARERMGSSGGNFLKKFSRDTAMDKARSLASIGSHEEDKEISFELLDTFRPSFIYKCLRKKPEFIEDWDRLTNMLKDFMSDQSETSYLSMDPMAKFWRKLVDRFPELVDFLAVADDETREKFNNFATNLYRNFYLTNKVTPLPLMDILNWRDYAPMAQWLAIAPDGDRRFFIDFMSDMFRTAGNVNAADILESKFHQGGPDPHLKRHASREKGLSNKKKRILESIASDVNPFQHSAAEKKLEMTTTALMAANKFRNSRRSDHASQSPPGPSTGTVSPEGVSEDGESTRSDTRKPRATTLNNQTSFQSEISIESKRSVSFAVDERGRSDSVDSD